MIACAGLVQQAAPASVPAKVGTVVLRTIERVSPSDVNPSDTTPNPVDSSSHLTQELGSPCHVHSTAGRATEQSIERIIFLVQVPVPHGRRVGSVGC
jgi:hypothetical protein